MAHERSWDRGNYSIQDSAGSRGTIAFEADTSQFLAAFFLSTSPRNPFLTRGSRAVPQPLDQMVPGHKQELAKNAMGYLLDDLDGVTVPVVTSAFWSHDTDDISESYETWSDVLSHGASLMSTELLPAAMALDVWRREFDLTTADMQLVHDIFERRIGAPDGPTHLAPEQTAHLQKIARGPAGLQACRRALDEIQVFW